MTFIANVVDKYFDFMDEIGGLYSYKEQVPDEMLTKAGENDFEELVCWKPVKSTVTPEEVEELENYFRSPLPSTYKDFLQHKHFVELQLGGHAISFFENLPGKLVSKTKEITEEYYWNLLERNYLPFAYLSDYGVVAFNANIKPAINDYPVITLIHDDEYDEPQEFAANFETMFIEFDSNLDDWITTFRSQKGLTKNN